MSGDKQPAQHGLAPREGSFPDYLLEVLLAQLRDNPEVLTELRELVAAEPPLYTPQTLGAKVGITARGVRAAIARGDLEARRSGRGYLITPEAARSWGIPKTSKRRRAVHRERRPMRDAFAGLGDS